MITIFPFLERWFFIFSEVSEIKYSKMGLRDFLIFKRFDISTKNRAIAGLRRVFLTKKSENVNVTWNNLFLLLHLGAKV